jgi:hypothetical protein
MTETRNEYGIRVDTEGRGELQMQLDWYCIETDTCKLFQLVQNTVDGEYIHDWKDVYIAITGHRDAEFTEDSLRAIKSTLTNVHKQRDLPVLRHMFKNSQWNETQIVAFMCRLHSATHQRDMRARVRAFVECMWCSDREEVVNWEQDVFQEEMVCKFYYLKEIVDQLKVERKKSAHEILSLYCVRQSLSAPPSITVISSENAVDPLQAIAKRRRQF